MTTVREFEKQVWQAEGVRVVLRASQAHAEANHNLRPYRTGPTAARCDGNCPVRRFKIILEAYTDIPFTIVGGNGLTPSLSVKLSEVRATYSAPPVKAAKKSVSGGLSGITGNLDYDKLIPKSLDTSKRLLKRFVEENIEEREKAKTEIKNLGLHGIHHSQAKGIRMSLAVMRKREKFNRPLKTVEDRLADAFLRSAAKLIGFKDVSMRKIVEMFEREMAAGPDSASAKVGGRATAK